MGDGTRALIERWAEALGSMNVDAMEELLHDDIVDEYPQSGERIIGKANLRALRMNYPGAEEQPLRGEVRALVGAEESWVMGPSYNITHIAGSGDSYAIAGTIAYPDGSVWHLAQFVRTKDARIWRLTSYFAPTFDPPAWRSQWVEVVRD